MVRNLAILLAFLVIFLGGTAVGIYTDYLWFREVGYTSVFRTSMVTKGILFLAGAVLVTLALWINIRIAGRPRKGLVTVRENLLEIQDRDELVPLVRRVLPMALVGVGLLAGGAVSSLWEMALRYLNPVAFSKADPLFGKDIAFYVFQLPMLKALHSTVFVVLALCLIVSALLYVLEGKVAAGPEGVAADPQVKPHLFTLVGLLLLLKAVGYRLGAYELLYSPRGVAFGASYTDVKVTLPVLTVLMVVAALSAVVIIISGYRRGWKMAAVVAGAWLVVSVVGGQVMPTAIQKVKVAPNELSMEEPYIRHGIAHTRAAFNLEGIAESDFAAEEGLTQEVLEKNRLTVENIRLWDHRPLLAAYEQLQEIRTYYDFSDVDVDRYTLDGKYRQIMLSAREISSERLPSKLWINERLTYTHGYGAVASPVNRFTREGLPDFLLKDIPPAGHPELKITRPEIYYGENLNDYVIVGTKARELNYPSGEQNVYRSYDGTGGVPVGGLFRRLAFAARFQSLPLLLNSDITPESRVAYYRRIRERLQRVAPFLLFERDPYLVISKGKLYWICDAYTATDRYPYSQPVRGMGNYMRNSVKAVVDAYHGTVTLYMADESDPIIQSYSKIFPKLLQPMAAMDEDLRKHLRYPQTLFDIQARMYAVYHMTDPQVFYNKEDVWEIPAGERSTAPIEAPSGPPSPFQRGPAPAGDPSPRSMEPYYTIMRLPQAEKEEFIQMIPFTPAKKDNLRAWMCVRNDPPHYGKMVVYNFPKAKLVYGPSQINARIEQEARISQQLTLWRQSGSDVLRGNLLIIPIEQSLLYVQALYMKAAKGEIPELKRVIAAHGDHIVMEESLELSLAKLFGDGTVRAPARPAAKPGSPSKPAPAQAGPAASRDELAREALEHLRKARDGYRRDDWAAFGEELRRLEETLNRLEKESGAR